MDMVSKCNYCGSEKGFTSWVSQNVFLCRSCRDLGMKLLFKANFSLKELKEAENRDKAVKLRQIRLIQDLVRYSIKKGINIHDSLTKLIELEEDISEKVFFQARKVLFSHYDRLELFYVMLDQELPEVFPELMSCKDIALNQKGVDAINYAIIYTPELRHYDCMMMRYKLPIKC